jgi:hypothetical protein
VFGWTEWSIRVALSIHTVVDLNGIPPERSLMAVVGMWQPSTMPTRMQRVGHVNGFNWITGQLAGGANSHFFCLKQKKPGYRTCH